MTRIALVTGANQGLGRAIAETLAARMAEDDLVLLTGRDPGRVKVAAAEAASGARARVEGRVLDVSDTAALTFLAKELGEVDIVVSNAIAPLHPDVSQSAQADEFIDVSNVATHTILRAYAPILRPGGRLIVVASTLGTLGHLPKPLHPLFEHATLEEVERAVEEWRAAIHAGTAAGLGWPRWLNVPSKVAQVAAVRAAARDRRDDDLAHGRLIAAVCPGMVDTRASRPWFSEYSHAQTPTKAAGPVVDLLLSERGEHYGELIRFGRPLAWHSGTPPMEQEQVVIP